MPINRKLSCYKLLSKKHKRTGKLIQSLKLGGYPTSTAYRISQQERGSHSGTSPLDVLIGQAVYPLVKGDRPVKKMK